MSFSDSPALGFQLLAFDWYTPPMPLDPQAQAFLDQVQAMNVPPFHTLSVEEARKAAEALSAFHGAPEPVGSVDNLAVPGPGGEIGLRVYTPEQDGPLPMLVYFHGGGWVLGDLESHDGVCRALTNAVNCIVVSVDYRLAPEHKFPAAAEDAYAAARWVAENAASLGGDPKRIAVGGDSAGGNLAAVAALMARDRGGPLLTYQLLIYPATDASYATASCRENGNGYLLTVDMMRWFQNHYLRSDADRDDPYAAPLRAGDLRGLPPALVITAEFDPLRDEGEAYAARLRAAGVLADLKRYDGMIHGFFVMGAVLDQARAAMGEVAASLQSAFSSPVSPSPRGTDNPLKRLIQSFRSSR
ncbi:MAG: alpha/beta hydrolase [Candidatus Binatia bacterium]